MLHLAANTPPCEFTLAKYTRVDKVNASKELQPETEPAGEEQRNASEFEDIPGVVTADSDLYEFVPPQRVLAAQEEKEEEELQKGFYRPETSHVHVVPGQAVNLPKHLKAFIHDRGEVELFPPIRHDDTGKFSEFAKITDRGWNGKRFTPCRICHTHTHTHTHTPDAPGKDFLCPPKFNFKKEEKKNRIPSRNKLHDSMFAFREKFARGECYRCLFVTSFVLVSQQLTSWWMLRLFCPSSRWIYNLMTLSWICVPRRVEKLWRCCKLCYLVSSNLFCIW